MPDGLVNFNQSSKMSDPLGVHVEGANARSMHFLSPLFIYSNY